MQDSTGGKRDWIQPATRESGCEFEHYSRESQGLQVVRIARADDAPESFLQTCFDIAAVVQCVSSDDVTSVEKSCHLVMERLLCRWVPGQAVETEDGSIGRLQIKLRFK